MCRNYLVRYRFHRTGFRRIKPLLRNVASIFHCVGREIRVSSCTRAPTARPFRRVNSGTSVFIYIRCASTTKRATDWIAPICTLSHWPDTSLRHHLSPPRWFRFKTTKPLRPNRCHNYAGSIRAARTATSARTTTRSCAVSESTA